MYLGKDKMIKSSEDSLVEKLERILELEEKGIKINNQELNEYGNLIVEMEKIASRELSEELKETYKLFLGYNKKKLFRGEGKKNV